MWGGKWHSLRTNVARRRGLWSPANSSLGQSKNTLRNDLPGGLYGVSGLAPFSNRSSYRMFVVRWRPAACNSLDPSRTDRRTLPLRRPGRFPNHRTPAHESTIRCGQCSTNGVAYAGAPREATAISGYSSPITAAVIAINGRERARQVGTFLPSCPGSAAGGIGDPAEFFSIESGDRACLYTSRTGKRANLSQELNLYFLFFNRLISLLYSPKTWSSSSSTSGGWGATN